MPTRVFSTRHARLVVVIGEHRIEVGSGMCPSRHERLDGLAADRGICNCNFDLRLLRCLLNGADQASAVVSCKTASSVYNGFGRICAVLRKVGHVELLPRCHLRRRKWIAPALAVPVINELAKY